MCNIVVKDIYSAHWLVSVTDDGYLTTVKVPGTFYHQDPVFHAGNAHVLLTALPDGKLQTEVVTSFSDSQVIDLLGLSSPNERPWKLYADSNGILYTERLDALPAEVIPIPQDISLVRIAAPGLICFSCGNQHVTALSDYSLWCCSCNSFVPDSDTNLIVVLDE